MKCAEIDARQLRHSRRYFLADRLLICMQTGSQAFQADVQRAEIKTVVKSGKTFIRVVWVFVHPVLCLPHAGCTCDCVLYETGSERLRESKWGEKRNIWQFGTDLIVCLCLLISVSGISKGPGKWRERTVRHTCKRVRMSRRWFTHPVCLIESALTLYL